MLYIVLSFVKLSQTVSKLWTDTIYILKITKGNYSAKNVGGAIVVNLCMSPVMLYICAKFHEIILNGIKVIEQTQFL